MNFYGIYQTEGANFNTTITTSCQGTLIDEFTVLTAAQCMLTSFFYRTADQKQYIAKVDPYNPNQYEVFLGVYDISSISGSYNEKLLSPIQRLSVKNVIIVSIKITELIFLMILR
jgi:V8-like Glu-specific endopeptidase